jgi:hypothetical protein
MQTRVKHTTLTINTAMLARTGGKPPHILMLQPGIPS